MATAAVISPTSVPSSFPQASASIRPTVSSVPQDVQAELHYHKPNEDGSPPASTYTDRPETYERPSEIHSVLVRDIRGREKDFSLDENGFQTHRHTASEKDFLDDEQIKSGYYAETEQLLKDA